MTRPTTRWLRDNCPCPRCLHPVTRERTVTLIDEPSIEAAITPMGDGGLIVDWGDGHVGTYPTEMLAYRSEIVSSTVPLVNVCRVAFADLNTSAGMQTWLSTMLCQGAVIVEGTPNVHGEVVRLAERIGYARPTNFGTIFDVESKPDPNNSAYTAAGLDLHSDLANYAHPPDFQFLHALANDADGGDTILADGVEVAKQLRLADPAAFALLSSKLVPFRFHDTDGDLRHAAPIIAVDAAANPVSIRFNNWLRDVDVDADEQFYDAYLALWKMLRDPANVVALRLIAGETLCFDNNRILHGRTPFDPQSGRRHLQGCYVDRDMVESRLRRLTL
jgi:gamma-butyrobetaine dioxygenase